MRNYQDMVYSTAVRLIGNETQAEDIAQEVFIKAHEHFDNLRSSPSAGGWLKTVATNLSLNHITRYKKRWSFFSDLVRKSDEGEEREVEFAAPDGSTHRARGLAGPDQSPDVGSTLPVAYDEEDPGRNAVVGYDDTGSSLLGMGVILTGVFWGLPLLVLLVRLPARRRRRREEARAAAG